MKILKYIALILIEAEKTGELDIILGHTMESKSKQMSYLYAKLGAMCQE